VIKSNLRNTHLKVIDKSDNKLIQMRRRTPSKREIATAESEKLTAITSKLFPLKILLKIGTNFGDEGSPKISRYLCKEL
jgi:hypothetical protein